MIIADDFPLQQTTAAISTSQFQSKNVIDNAVLVKLIQSKSERGFSILYDKYSSSLYGIIIKFVIKSDVADELLKVTFFEIWKNIDDFDSTKNSLFTWMLKIARNQAINYMRASSNNTQSLCVNMDAYTLHTNYLGKSVSNISELEFMESKTTILSQLDPEYTQVIDFILFYGSTYEQTAQILNLPIETVKIRITKGLELLKVLYLK